ncbi:nucleotide exchange factor GrpE [Geothrix sp. 21YS21S-4]|uniref:nucleotide exchange factor GrpE n=1 Tax=Geothrix sp. 21YS21S-4 TaxID=3068889 RepID=UPI0027B88C88|nr:nucleotide exchange factor GrpE [Geothrix sp. 21YS21S-4]
MAIDTPHEPNLRPQEEPDAPLSAGAEDLVDLNLDESVDGDLQAVADEVASEYPTQVVPEVDLESALTEAERQMEEMLRREAELMDQHRRLAADFNNFRNRAQRDVALAVEQAERKLLLELLPVLDNFDRGLSASYQDVESFRSGVDLIRKQFVEALRRMNVEPLSLQVGDPFDALHAEALTTFTDPNLPDGAVAAIYERGFNLRGHLLRAARVVVNRLPEPGKS